MLLAGHCIDLRSSTFALESLDAVRRSTMQPGHLLVGAACAAIEAGDKTRRLECAAGFLWLSVDRGPGLRSREVPARIGSRKHRSRCEALRRIYRTASNLVGSAHAII